MDLNPSAFDPANSDNSFTHMRAPSAHARPRGRGTGKSDHAPISSVVLSSGWFVGLGLQLRAWTMRGWITAAVLLALNLAQSDPARSATAEDPWKALKFLEGTWDARTQSGSAGAQVGGRYTFKPELEHHVLARHSESAGCKGPRSYDCKHSDLLYIYQDAEGQPLRALYLDNEGHVIHYTVSTPAATTALFISEASPSGPQFQLVYQLTDGIMSGKFQMRMFGQADWKTYLEWSGAKQ
jgi:hypothetical protein